jgi:hypothetical protein
VDRSNLSTEGRASIKSGVNEIISLLQQFNALLALSDQPTEQ